MTQQQQLYLLNRADEACDLLKSHIEKQHVVRLISHNDADGLTSAGIFANAIQKAGGRFHTTILPRLRDSNVKELNKSKYKLFIFSDMGSGNLDSISKLKGDVIIADHHQVPEGTEPEIQVDNKQIIHVNPHIFNIDGTKDVSGSGLSYLSVHGYEFYELAGLALTGAYGDMQFKHGPTGINKLILDEAIEHNTMEIKDELKLAYSNSQPLYKAITYTYNPVIQGLSGNIDETKQFLDNHNIPKDKLLSQLSKEEYETLKNELININENIYGEIYTIPNIRRELTNIEEYSNLLNACGKNKEYTAALSIQLGKYAQIDYAESLLSKYSSNMQNGIEWIKREGSIQEENIQYIYTEDKELKKVAAAVSSIGIDLGILPDKPVLSLMKMDNLIKVSSRTTDNMVEQGVNLGVIMNQASNNFNGSGGGHNIAAGATIPANQKDNFIHLVDEMVEYQINNN
ncbi:DHHA1 domain-containing protein [Methanosphaera sp.]|uniref:DHH family phosphoesterase n=1 Tax=Methanosphaera sp. TaxID=2666342 RepID=UPI002A56CFA7|nr:DHH family phosphoesterase [Methanobacteriaceae archaeon]MDY2744605.1 DHH family phosphoesterase [Methanosphaera sp.]